MPISLALDLMRHGDALPAGAGGDSARKLSPAGIRELERLGLHLSRLGWRPDHVFASPFIRARESAKIVLQHVPDLRVERLDALSPDRDPKDVVAALGEQEIIQGHVVLVGHQPLLGRLATWLTGRGAPALPPGTLMRLELEGPIIAGAAELRWVLRPENVA